MTNTPRDMDSGMPVPPGVDPTVPSAARLYDYGLGGTHNYQADRDAMERVRAIAPELSQAAWANRGFHQRAARWIAQQGIRQFIDIGSGLPTTGNTHQVVEKAAPGAHVVYADHDPIVLAHATELLAGTRTATLIQADLRDPDALLGNKELRSMIDFTKPAGLLLTGVLHFVSDTADPWGLVRRYADALAPGSYVAISHITADTLPPRTVHVFEDMFSRSAEKVYFRPREDVTRFFEGLEIVPPYEGAAPAVVYVGMWDCEPPEDPGDPKWEDIDDDSSRWLYAAVARRP